MKKYYFSFGQTHTHSYNNGTLDRNCIVEIEAKDSEEARIKMFKLFGQKWSSQYNQIPNMRFFTGGIIKII